MPPIRRGAAQTQAQTAQTETTQNNVLQSLPEELLKKASDVGITKEELETIAQFQNISIATIKLEAMIEAREKIKESQNNAPKKTAPEMLREIVKEGKTQAQSKENTQVNYEYFHFRKSKIDGSAIDNIIVLVQDIKSTNNVRALICNGKNMDLRLFANRSAFNAYTADLKTNKYDIITMNTVENV